MTRPSPQESLPDIVEGCSISLCSNETTYPPDHQRYLVKIKAKSGQDWTIRFEPKGDSGKIILEADIFKSLDDTTCSTKEVTPEILTRIQNILPATNYSHCLRNSEHVANYIFHGAWTSLQMQNTGGMRKYFKLILTPELERQIATTPGDLKAMEAPREQVPLFNHIELLTDAKVVKQQDMKPTAYNIALVGPTGAGKSTITNILFNLNICETKTSVAAVTRDIHVVQGRYKCADGETITVNVVDTMGLCDQFVEDEDAVKNLANAIGSESKIDKVVVVVDKTPLKESHKITIKNLLNELKYPNNKDNFLFLFNKTEKRDYEKKQQMLRELGEDLGVDIDYQIPVITPATPGDDILKNTTHFLAGQAVGVNPANLMDDKSKKTINTLKTTLLPHVASVLRSPKRLDVNQGCKIQ